MPANIIYNKTGDRLVTPLNQDANDPLPANQTFINVALIDKRPLTLASFSNFINNHSKEFAVAPYHSPEDFIESPIETSTTLKIIILNIGAERIYPETSSDVINRIKNHLPSIPLVLIADCEESCCILTALKMGVQGYITTSLLPAVVLAAIKLVLEGGLFVPIMSLILPTDNNANQSPPFIDRRKPLMTAEQLQLTPRQMEVLEHVKLGEPNKVIAYKLGMQECTVKVHVRDIMKKLHATNRTQLVYLAGLIKSGNGAA